MPYPLHLSPLFTLAVLAAFTSVKHMRSSEKEI